MGHRREAQRPFDDKDKWEWFQGECELLGLDPAKTTLLDYLGADDRAFCERIVRDNPISIGN